MGYISKVLVVILLAILGISIVITLLVIPLEPILFHDGELTDLMEDEKLVYVEGLDPDNDSKYEYISFGIEFTMIVGGEFNITIVCDLGDYVSEMGEVSIPLEIREYNLELYKGVHTREYLILTSLFMQYNKIEFTIDHIIIADASSYDYYQDPVMVSKIFDLSNLDFNDPYVIHYMNFKYYDDSGKYGFERGNFLFEALFSIPIHLEFEINMRIYSNNSIDRYTYQETGILNMTSAGFYSYSLDLNFTDFGEVFTHISDVKHEFLLMFDYDIRIETISGAMSYQEPQETNTTTNP